MKTQRILIVDDDPNLRKALSDILKARGYRSTAVGTGRAALEHTEEEPPGVALIDLRLDDMSGLEVMRGIKERSSGTECIVLTGHASQASAIEAINLGAYSYVQKPYDVEQLLVTVRRAIERQEAEQALKKSESDLTKAQHIAHVGSWTRDLETNELLWSQETCRMFGVSPEDFDVRFEAFLDCVHREDRESVLKAVEDALNTREPHQVEYRIVRPDGEVRIVIERGQVIADESGHPIQLGTVQDITERKRAEEALRRSRDEWTSTFDAMSDWVTLFDLEARILRTNAAGEDLVGVPPAEMVGQTCCKLVHGTDEPIPGCPLQKMLGTHQRETVELQVPGGDRWLMITVEPVMDDDGNLIRAVHIVRDITERKRAEEEKENLQAHLL